jgi:F-type H+-transporting ATPase subunit alpha
MKKIAGRLRLDLAQFRELEAFAAFGSDLDAASKSQLERGGRLVELLKQNQYTPFILEKMIASIWAGTTGQLDSVPLPDIKRFEAEFLEYLSRDHKGVLDVIATTKELSDDTVAALTAAITTFKDRFVSSVTKALNEAPVKAEGDDLNEQVTKYVQPAAKK